MIGDRVRDVVAVVAALAIGALLVTVGDPTGPVPGLVPWPVDVVIGVPACFALLLRRRRPLGLAALVVPLSAVSVMATGAVLGAVFGLALRRRPAVAAWFAAGYLGTIPIYLLLQREPRMALWTDLVVRGVLVTAALGWGLYARERQALIDNLDERATRAEAEQASRVAGARRDERDRIAREMHDVLAHRLSMISLQAGALELHPALAPDVHQAAGVIRSGAHEALEELRSVIGVLRHDAGEEPEPPQPGLAEVPDLVADARRFGSDVRLDDHLAELRPPGVTGRVAYRVVQEALTNARKHAPGNPVRLVLDGGPGEGLRIEVSNPAPGAAPGSVPGSGVGLAGLAERVELAGGRLVHGPAAGRFRLEARLPWLA
ncbi:sensor histidine kinase [Paractinoplanes durhamensis]|uniref:histidine kinase n=1 Tax=Paractinoplanes durhamensis TaxID=113563 RepID=A0ABQ3YUJ9_9ACTN|nr:histidine kinase [Actinoplanes durhamensis]GIE01222.1 two-component sensor histidine kinase [Actinoplanes durhamensis]